MIYPECEALINEWKAHGYNSTEVLQKLYELETNYVPKEDNHAFRVLHTLQQLTNDQQKGLWFELDREYDGVRVVYFYYLSGDPFENNFGGTLKGRKGTWGICPDHIVDWGFEV